MQQAFILTKKCNVFLLLSLDILPPGQWTILNLPVLVLARYISKAASNPRLFPRVFHNNKFLPTKSPKQYQK